MWWITAGCLLAKGIRSHLKATQALKDVWQASETSHSKSSLWNFQHQYLPELLVNVYGCRFMVNSVFCCCVCGSRLFSNPVTILITVVYRIIDIHRDKLEEQTASLLWNQLSHVSRSNPVLDWHSSSESLNTCMELTFHLRYSFWGFWLTFFQMKNHSTRSRGPLLSLQ